MESYEFIDDIETEKNDNEKIPPYINYVTFNRMGLTIRNLNNLLDSDEDFELNIIDSNSKDNTWDYIKSLNDRRIKSITRFNLNIGPIYPLNYGLTKRKPGQYYITIDSDTFIKTKNWIARFMEIFDAFPDVGLLGVVRDKPYPRYVPPVIPRQKVDIGYLQLKNANVGVDLDFVPGQLQCLRPELIDVIGYWNEECGYGDAELSPRIVHYTPFKVGYATTVDIDMTQYIGCNVCQGRELCKLSRSVNTCFSLSRTSNYNESFVRVHGWKYKEIFKELEEGKRTAFSASALDPLSIINHYYNHIWATENFDYYVKNSNPKN